MFKTRRTKNLEGNVKKLLKELKDYERKLDRLESENKRIKSDLEYEHEENYANHKVLLAIQKSLNKPYGSYNDLMQTRKDIKKELDNAINID